MVTILLFLGALLFCVVPVRTFLFVKLRRLGRPWIEILISAMIVWVILSILIDIKDVDDDVGRAVFLGLILWGAIEGVLCINGVRLWFRGADKNT